MVKQRREEARLAESRELGIRNLRMLESARGWCKHLHAEMTSYGLLAEISGLPIGSHDITCPHAEHGVGGMNLPWILPDFVVNNCVGCPKHEPNGDTEWGERVIAGHESRERQEAERQSRLTAQLEALRASMRAEAKDAQGRADFTAHGILELTESLFSEEAGERSAASSSLRQAGKVAAELFHPTAADLILSSACQPDHAELCLPVAAALAGRRDDYTERLVSVAVGAFNAGLPIEPACEILLGCGCGVSRPIPAGVIEKVVRRQNHIRPIGGWPTVDPDCPLISYPPSYAGSTALLVRAYDQDCESVLEPLRAEFRDNNKVRRVNACGVARQLMAERPESGAAILPVVFDSLDLDDDVYNDSADSEACALIGDIFVREPALTDGLLRERFDAQSAEAQALTGDAYRQVFRRTGSDKLDPARFGEALSLAIRRCLALVQDDRAELEVRQDFAEALESACRNHPDLAMAKFDTLFGALACLCAREEPPPVPPRIILPGSQPPDPRLRGLEQENRRMAWHGFKERLAKCLEELAERRPSAVAERLMACLPNLDSKTHEALKAKTVKLLGKLGRDRDTLPRVLPPLWVALMDYGSPLIRCRAVEAVECSFAYADCAPPPDIVDALVLHLRDTFVIVHKAAISAVERLAGWLTPEQAEDALQHLCGWAGTYRKKDVFTLKDICRAILAVSARRREWRFGAVRFLTNLLPTAEPLVDLELIETLTWRVEPCEDGAYCVAPKVASWLAASGRDPMRDHADDARQQAFDWLVDLPEETFHDVRAKLLEEARQVATRGDAWCACRFAAVFASFGDFGAEAEVLGLTHESLAGGRLHERTVEALRDLEQAAKANRQLALAAGGGQYP